MADSAFRPDLVLFDLDGTLVQSREAAWEYFEATAARYGLPFSTAEEFHAIFAGNFSQGLRAACPDEATFQQVKDEYFDILEREYTPPLVPGMREVVTHLAERTTLGVVSSNVLKVVRRVLVTNGIATCIAHVFTGDINPSKRDVINKLRANVGFTLGRHCSPNYDESQGSISDSTAAVYLVTDTVGDCEEALAAGAIPIGVSWGMHTEGELRRAGAEEVCLWPQELVALLGRGPKLGSCDLAPVSPAAPNKVGRDGEGRAPRPVGLAQPTPSILDRVQAANSAIRREGGPPRGSHPTPCCESCVEPGGTPRSVERTTSLAGRAAIDPDVLAAVTRTAVR